MESTGATGAKANSAPVHFQSPMLHLHMWKVGQMEGTVHVDETEGTVYLDETEGTVHVDGGHSH
jgi:hypothetical protein